MGFIHNGVNAGSALVNDFSSVNNLRKEMYKKKCEIVKTPMVRDIVSKVFGERFLPSEIIINASGVFTYPYDETSCTYHPNGICSYTSEVAFDYIFAAALASLFEDLYPSVYEINKVTVQELSYRLEMGTWSVSLSMREEYKRKVLNPSFDIFNISDTPIEKLPLVLEDKYTKRIAKTGAVSLVLGIAAIVLSVFNSFFAYFFAIAGCVFGAISLFTTDKKEKKAIVGLILSVLAMILPLIIGVIALVAFFN